MNWHTRIPASMTWRPRIPAALNRLMTRLGFSHEWYLIPLAAIVGVLAGLVAYGFAAMVHFCNDLFFVKIAGNDFQGWRLAILALLPALGGLGVGLVQRFLSHAPPGHGIPEVIEAMARKGGKIPGRVGLFKAVNSSLTIGSGGSGGMEGPIVQIGSVLGSVIGQFLLVSREHMITLVGCGAAAGLASLFNAPIAASLFVLEVMLRDFSLRTFMPIVVACVFGSATTQAILGRNESIFHVTASLTDFGFHLNYLGWYCLLGLLCGLVGVAFTKGLYAAEHFWERRVPLPHVLKPATGGLILGLMGIVFVLWFGNPVPGYKPPAFFSNGYPVIESLFLPESYNHSGASNAGEHPDAFTLHTQDDHPVPGEEDPIKPAEATLAFLLAALAFKLAGTCITLGSGGSGGVFAPSLFMGAMLGGGFGKLLQLLGLIPHSTPATYALAGMAGVLAGSVHCPLTSFLLVFEVTRDYKVILPVMLVSVLATLISQYRLRDSIYTLALREQGIRMGSTADLTILRRLSASSVPFTKPIIVHPDEPAQRLIDLAVNPAVTDYVVCDQDQRYVGLVVGEDVLTTLLQREAVPLMIVGELMRTDPPVVNLEETLESVLDKFARHEASSLAVVDADKKVLGTLTRSQLMRFYQQELDEKS